MKLEKITHDHLLTKWLKVMIFAILMLAPIFSVAIRCAYVVCNKNAYQSYSGQEQLTLTEVNDALDLNKNEYGNVFKFTNTNANENITSTEISYTYIEFLGGNLTETQINNLSNSNRLQLYYSSVRTCAIFYGSNQVMYLPLSEKNFEVKVNNVSLTNDAIDRVKEYLFYYEVSDLTKLDNVFDYSVNQLKNDQLFNWTQQTGVYTGVNAMTTGLGLTDGTISILITYWTLLSIIYVIIDIVIEGFVALTHMILKKAS